MKRHIQPPEVFASGFAGFSQVVACTPGMLVFVSGQVAWDSDRNLIGGGDLGAQAEQALTNLGHCLDAAGASRSDVTSYRLYIVDLPSNAALILVPLLQAFFGEHAPTASWIGVQSLASPELLIEIEAVAVVAG